MRRTTKLSAALVATTLVAVSSGTTRAGELAVYTSSDPILKLRTVAYEGGKTKDFTIGIGSGAYRPPFAPANMFYTVSDRGPNFPCAQAEKFIGLKGDDVCKNAKKGRIYPTPDYSPSIYTVQLQDDLTFAIKDVVSFKDRDGNPINGLLNPLTVATTETPVATDGSLLAQNADAIDAEGIVRLRDGTFWIGEENAPSILHVAADGRILLRVVPAGTEGDFKDANYAVKGGLPAIFAKRQANRGIESMAVSGDENFLYTIMQNPLANPDAGAYKKARNTRLIKIDRGSLQVIGEYVYELDLPQSFRNDPSDAQNAPRISELHWLGKNRLLVLERTNKTTKLHEVDLSGASNILGGKWDDLATAPSLEQTATTEAGIKPVSKTLRFDSADFKTAPNKIEGIAFLGDGSLVLVNDNDFGIGDDDTKVVVLKDSGIPRD